MGTITRFSKAAALAALLLATALSIMVTACGAGTDGTGGTGNTEPTSSSGTSGDEFVLAMSGVARLTSTASQADVLSAAAGIQAFGADLYRILVQDAGDGNLVFAPTSIATALAMTYAGAAGTTAEEMAATLHFTLEGDALHQAFNSLDATLESRSWQQEDKGVLVKTANSLWGQKGTVFEPVFLDTLAANYGTGMRLVDYETETTAEEARQAINAWVADETEDKITDLIGDGVLDQDTLLVLVNAAYLVADWTLQFDPEQTEDRDFTTLTGKTLDTPMMSQAAHFPYARGNGWQAVELSYLGDQLAMLLIVPDEGRFDEVEAGLASSLIDETVAQLTEYTKVLLTLPKFEFRTQARLDQALIALGMGSAFHFGADFTGMAAGHEPWISAVMHEAFIIVDEEGTEAGAATAVEMMEGTMTTLPKLVELVIDRPFLFALRDRETGAILFLGRVTDPTK